MNLEPVNPDDPQLTAYALDELTLSERAEFEAQLELSPDARKELESMEEMMAMLSKGLKEEWCSEMNEPSLEVLPSVAADNVIEPVQFRQSRRAIAAIAAAVTALLLVGGGYFSQQPGGPASFASSESTEVGEGASALSAISELPILASAGGVSVPHLLLTEQVKRDESVNLAQALENLDEVSAGVDATYLEAASVGADSPIAPSVEGAFIPASDTSVDLAMRVDSYLPEMAAVSRRAGIDSGLIEGRIKRLPASVSEDGDGRSVFVRGYVAMDGGLREEATPQPGRVLAGFRPVSIIGNPVKDADVDLRLISDFQAIQNDLSNLLEALPADSDARVRLQDLVEKNGKAIRSLKREFFE